jgi:hypothetical protein
LEDDVNLLVFPFDCEFGICLSKCRKVFIVYTADQVLHLRPLQEYHPVDSGHLEAFAKALEIYCKGQRRVQLMCGPQVHSLLSLCHSRTGGPEGCPSQCHNLFQSYCADHVPLV